MTDSRKSITTIPANVGQILSVMGDTYRIVITGEQTESAYAVIDMLVPPQGGPGPHAHTGFEESFYVIDGEVEVTTEYETYTAKKGSFVNIPLGGLVHCFKNTTNAVAHLWCVVVPAGLEDLFIEIGKPVSPGTFLPPPQMTGEELEKLKDVVEKHGQKIYPPDYLAKVKSHKPLMAM